MAEHEVLRDNLILLGRVGSSCHGLNLPGTDDQDLMGIFVEPPEYLVGLRGIGTIVQRTKPEGERSEHGDIDIVLHGLRKWASLAANGNPTVLTMLYLPTTELMVARKRGLMLQRMYRAFASKRAIRAFLGYMAAQKERLVGQRGQMRVTRQELIDAHGYDTKYAMHVLRLARQGHEFALHGRISLPMQEPDRSQIMSVRRGEVSLDGVLGLIANAESALESLKTTSALPDEPDHDAINEFLVQTYRAWWRDNGWNYDVRGKREMGSVLDAVESGRLRMPDGSEVASV